MLSNHSYANGVEKWLDLSLQVATNLWLPVYCRLLTRITLDA